MAQKPKYLVLSLLVLLSSQITYTGFLRKGLFLAASFICLKDIRKRRTGEKCNPIRNTIDGMGKDAPETLKDVTFVFRRALELTGEAYNVLTGEQPATGPSKQHESTQNVQQDDGATAMEAPEKVDAIAPVDNVTLKSVLRSALRLGEKVCSVFKGKQSDTEQQEGHEEPQSEATGDQPSEDINE